jgi:hypothetical protein
VTVDTTDASRDCVDLYRGDPEARARSLNRIQRAAPMVLAAMEPNR